MSASEVAGNVVSTTALSPGLVEKGTAASPETRAAAQAGRTTEPMGSPPLSWMLGEHEKAVTIRTKRCRSRSHAPSLPLAPSQTLGVRLALRAADAGGPDLAAKAAPLLYMHRMAKTGRFLDPSARALQNETVRVWK